MCCAPTISGPGRFRLALQTCDDSLAQSGQPDEGKCLANANAYADNPAVIGVVGPIHSFCAEAMLPTLNSAPAGPVSVVSPTNTWIVADPWLRRSAAQALPDRPARLRACLPGRRGR